MLTEIDLALNWFFWIAGFLIFKDELAHRKEPFAF
jgi:hypothetical protein